MGESCWGPAPIEPIVPVGGCVRVCPLQRKKRKRCVGSFLVASERADKSHIGKKRRDQSEERWW